MDTADSAGPAERLGDLLLLMAGRVDDDAVNTTREMLGTGHSATAAEFLVGCLLAGRIPVTAAEGEQLEAVLDELRCPREFAERLDVVDGMPDHEHRFSEQPSSGEELVDALAPVAGRLSGVRGLWCAWRTTPAGVTYGAVPQRVLLAEVGSDGSTVAAGYQLVEALRRAGISCAVDAFATGTDLPAYHRDALGSARRVHLDLPAGAANGHASPNHGRAPRTSSSGEPAGVSELSGEPLTPPPDPAPTPAARGVPGIGGDRDESPHEPSSAAEAATDEVEDAEVVEDRGAGDGAADEGAVGDGAFDGGALGDSALESSALDSNPLDSRAFDSSALDSRALDGGAWDGGAWDGGAWESGGTAFAPAGESGVPTAVADDFAVTDPVEPLGSEVARSEAATSEEVEQLDGQTFEQAVEEFAGTAPSNEDSAAEPERAESEESGLEEPVSEESGSEDSGSEDQDGAEDDPDGSAQGESNMKVPAAVDAKLTDRERNLLRKLHEELAQREHDRDGSQRVANQSWSEMPGAGGFPQIGAGRQHRRQ